LITTNTKANYHQKQPLINKHKEVVSKRFYSPKTRSAHKGKETSPFFCYHSYTLLLLHSFFFSVYWSKTTECRFLLDWLSVLLSV
jgi:hypothetical protein